MHNSVYLGNDSITALYCNVSSISSLSDERVKRDVQDSTLGLLFINKLRPVKYKRLNPADYPEPLLNNKYKEDASGNRPLDNNEVAIVPCRAADSPRIPAALSNQPSPGWSVL